MIERKTKTMDYRRFGNTIVARFDRGEEVTACVKEIALAEDIKLANVSGLGASNDITLGVFDPVKKELIKHHFTGNHEVSGIIGTINTLDGEFYSHLHITAAGEDGLGKGGHLFECVISATCEMVITVIDGTVDRKFDPEVGLNLFDFE